MNEQTSRVNVHSKLTAVSSKPVEPGKARLLNPLDLAMGKHSLHLVFYYEKNPFRSFDWDPLRVSLSETLSLYPSVTGRLTRGDAGNWEVKYNDAGVRVLRAKVSVGIDQWLKYGNGIDEKDLAVWEEMPENPSTWSPFRIQVSEFEGGGIAIGINCSHMNADLTSLILLFKAWTDAHRLQAIAHPPVFSSAVLHGRPVPNTYTKSVRHYVNKAVAEAPSVKMASATFKFSNSAIKRCLSDVCVHCPDATPFDLLTAIFWISVAHLKGSKKGDNKHSISICMDFRRMLKEPLGYFGNALHFSLLSLGEKDMVPGELPHVADAVHHHLAGIEEEEILSVVDWLESRKGDEEKSASPFRMYGPELTCVSMEHLINSDQSLMYAVMFDDNVKPAHVACHIGNIEGEGLIMVMPSPEEGLARTVSITLPEEEMVKLVEDETILSLKPKMLLNGGL